MTPATLRTLADLAVGLAEPAPLRAAAEALEAPLRVVLLGRVGAGKTTLANAWTGTAHPTGLGGVTRSPHEAEFGDARLVDTPGIDDPDAAIVALGALLATADHLVWVVDGLQPVTAGEREVVDAIVPAGTIRHTVVSRAELLDPTDREAVAARVEALTGAVPVLADLRRAPPRPPAFRPGPRRHALAQAAVDELRTTLAATPAPRDLASLRQALRRSIRATVERLRTAIEAGELPDKGAARAALLAAAPAVHADVVLGLVDAPRLPLPPAPGDTLWDQVRDRASGREGARRVLEAEAGRWLLEGQLALAEWCDAHPDHVERADRRRALDEALAALQNR